MKKNLKRLTLLVCVGIILFYLYKSFVEHTICSTFLVTTALYLIVYISLTSFLKRKNVNPNWTLSIGIFLGLVFLIEIYFRYVDPKYLSFLEVNGTGGYVSQYQFLPGTINRDHFYSGYDPNSTWISKTTEFTYTHTYNNIGFRGKDVFPKKKDEYRILTFSDSFTEGIGTPDDSTWSILLEQKLQTKCNPNFSVINLGLAGSDPVFALKLLSEQYDVLEPDAVILLVNTSDISDLQIRGGVDRFDANGDLHYKTGPWWEYFYASSFIARRIVRGCLYFDSDFTSFYDSNEKQQIKNYLNIHKTTLINLTESIQLMYQFCFERNIDFRVVFIPEGQEEVSPGIDFVENNLTIPNKLVLDMNNYLKSQSILDYYWPIDGHFNSRGYYLISEYIFNFINCSGKPPK